MPSPDRNEPGRDRTNTTGPVATNRSVDWSRSLWWPCADGKWRRVPATDRGEVEPGLFPLGDGLSGRVGLLRGAGNAIVPQVAAEFIKAFKEMQ